jgi:hypothetical protein
LEPSEQLLDRHGTHSSLSCQYSDNSEYTKTIKNIIDFCVISGTCLDFVGEARRVSERITALEKASEGIDSLWSDPQRRCAIVLLQDCAQHIGEAVDGCQRSLMTMYSVMLPRNPLPGSFPLLLDTFRSSQ